MDFAANRQEKTAAARLCRDMALNLNRPPRGADSVSASGPQSQGATVVALPSEMVVEVS